jgi:Terminase large subunit, T4likevirus-type, N-terminal
MRSNIATRLTRIEARLQKREQEQTARLPVAWVDPVFFARSVGFDPDPWQEDVLHWTGKRLLLNCSRQSGKSTITALLALHTALYVPRSLILLISPLLRQSSELFRKVQEFLFRIPIRPSMLEDNKLSLHLRNSSRIVSLPSSEETIRGFSGVSLIVEDEAARVDDNLFYALRPMLAVSSGRHILMSTPWGRRGHFFDCWEEGGPDWERVCVPATECPRIPATFLAEERRSMPDLWFRSEYNCEFLEVDGVVFRADDLIAALENEVQPLRFATLNGGAAYT